MAKCINGHYYDAGKYKECPDCGSKELSSENEPGSEKESEIVRLKNEIDEAEAESQYYKEEIIRLENRIKLLEAECAKYRAN